MYLHSPTKCTQLRGNDPTGNGWFGAKRGKKLHRGVDYLTIPGENIFAVASGRIRVGNVYENSTEMKLVEIKGKQDVHNVKAKQMYVLPYVKTGDYVKKGQIIGVAQDIANFHNSEEMENHMHLTVWKNGLLTDPEPIVISN